MPFSPAEFVARWSGSEGREIAVSQLFLTELCDLLDVEHPGNDAADDRYAFEKAVTFPTGGHGRIDLYRRGCFVLESKQGSERRTAEEEALLPGRKKKTGTAVRGTPAWDRAMLKARNQAEDYAKALPAAEGWPPFLIVIDIGLCFDLYTDFTQAGKAYLPFPDPNGFRLKLADLEREDTRELLRAIWTDPLSLDPARKSAAVTRDLAARLAALAKLLEREHPPEAVAAFLMRCLFTMFAEDIELLAGPSKPGAPSKAGKEAKPFTALLRKVLDDPASFPPMVEDLWRAMDKGGFSPAIAAKVRHFNGGLFAETTALPLSAAQITLLLEAAESDWKNVEPAIFGTLLERALDPVERHKLGAHYTPRAYVERLVLPTVIEPLRAEWADVTAAAAKLEEDGDRPGALELVQGYYDRLLNVRVLDPACGSGNFLYVAMEHMKRLEGEVTAVVNRLGGDPELLGVQPDQFLGIEINPRAREIADLVLWIGYIQWHLRSRGAGSLGDPVLHKLDNIECRDAVLDHDGAEPVLDPQGNPVTRWDGRTTKPHPVTGEPVPDDSARVPVLRYKNPRKADWPRADYVVGNPPFIGNKRMRVALGDGYVDALRKAHPIVPESADLVMFWWDRAAGLAQRRELLRFGFVTTNSITQSFNRQVLATYLSPQGGDPLSLAFAIPNHPWVESADGADVRIAMTVATQGATEGALAQVTSEFHSSDDTPAVMLSFAVGRIHPDLTVGADTTSCLQLRSNALGRMDIRPRGFL